jgi:hypothetical protein
MLKIRKAVTLHQHRFAVLHDRQGHAGNLLSFYLGADELVDARFEAVLRGRELEKHKTANRNEKGSWNFSHN